MIIYAENKLYQPTGIIFTSRIIPRKNMFNIFNEFNELNNNLSLLVMVCGS